MQRKTKNVPRDIAIMKINNEGAKSTSITLRMFFIIEGTSSDFYINDKLMKNFTAYFLPDMILTALYPEKSINKRAKKAVELFLNYLYYEDTSNPL